MSYYANQLREHGRNYFDEDAANELDRLEDELAAANQQLAAQALTIKTMREALEKFIDSHEECTDFDGFTAQIVSMDDYHEAQEALALPNDATALNELIAERTKTQKEYYESVFQDGANRIAELTAEVERLMAEHQAACELVAKMHAAAVGEITGPKRGVVEDVADAIAKLRDELETERMRLAGCGVAALGYFDGCCDTYKSASLDDVLRLRDRNAELTAENRELRMSRSLRQEQHDGEIAELTAQRDVAIGILEHIRRHEKGEQISPNLSDDDVRAIRADQRPQTKIAAQYGISQSNVSQIKARKTWVHVDDYRSSKDEA